MIRRAVYRVIIHPGIAFGLSVLALVSHAAMATPEANALATPDAAVEQLVHSLAAEDFDGALAAFAIDDYAAHVDFVATARGKRGINPGIDRPPSQHKLYRRSIAIEARRAAADDLLHLAMALLVGDPDQRMHDCDPTLSTSDPTCDPRAVAMDMAQLHRLELVRVDPPAALTRTPGLRQVLEEHAVALGADSVTERVALLRLADQHYWCGFRLVKYGSRWRILTLESQLAPVFLPEHVKKATLHEYEAITK